MIREILSTLYTIVFTRNKHVMINHKFISNIILAFSGVIALWALSSCAIATPTSNPQQQVDSIDQTAMHQALQSNIVTPECPNLVNDMSYRVGADDEVTITIYNEDNLSNKYTIPNSGTINMPLIGETALSGCSLKQIEQLLFDKYTAGYLINPNIAVSISQYGPFYIIGEVREPGRYDYIVDMNIVQAVALAGGFTYRANKKKVKILKGQKNNNPVYESATVESKVHPGDVIFIKERFF